MVDRYSEQTERNRQWREGDDTGRERWRGGEAASFSDARTSGYGREREPGRPDYYGAGRDTADYEPRWDRSSNRYSQAFRDRYHRDDRGQGWRESDEARWDRYQAETRRREAELARQRYEASRFTSDDYEPTRAGFDPYVRGYGGRGSTSRPGYGFGGREPQYAYGGDADRGWWDHAKDRVAGVFGDDEARLRADHDSYRGYEPERGRYYGHGPKGYSRSDDRVSEDVSDRLSDDSWLDASAIEVKVSGAEVTLAGTVHSRSDKRRAEDLADSVSGVKHVQNNLRVQSASSTVYGETSVPSTRAAGSTTGKVS